MTRQRADVLLAERGIFPSRERARAAILAGDVRVAGEVIRKAGTMVAPDAAIEVTELPRFVSRGGLKLDGALERFSLDVTGMDAIDIGASTGGFTDCLLQRGAVTVAAVDVGYGQLAWKLREDPRVSVFERTNIRHADPGELGGPFDLAVIDVSFISLELVLPKVVELTKPDGILVALVKPQFEAGKGRVGKRGVVRDPVVHEDVLATTLARCRAAGFGIRGVTWSPIRGPEGNIEFWVWADRRGGDIDLDLHALVDEAHRLAT